MSYTNTIKKLMDDIGNIIFEAYPHNNENESFANSPDFDKMLDDLSARITPIKENPVPEGWDRITNIPINKGGVK